MVRFVYECLSYFTVTNRNCLIITNIQCVFRFSGCQPYKELTN